MSDQTQTLDEGVQATGDPGTTEGNLSDIVADEGKPTSTEGKAAAAEEGEGSPSGNDELPSFSTAVPTEYRHLTKDFESHKDFMKSLVDGKETAEKELAEFRTNVPESPEGYEFDIPSDVELTDEAQAAFRAFAHENKLTKEQAAKQLSWMLERSLESGQAARQVREGTDKALKEAFGSKTKERLKVIDERVLSSFDHGPAVREIALRSQYGLPPAVYMLLNEVAEKVTEGSAVQSHGKPTNDPRARIKKMYPSMAEMG